jgi:hypothetical protein
MEGTPMSRPTLKEKALAEAEPLPVTRTALPAVPVVLRDASKVTITAAGLTYIRSRASEAATQGLIAAELGIPHKTLKALVQSNEDVKLAWEHGKAEFENELVQTLLAAARKGAIVPALFLLKTRHGYVEGAQPADTNKTNIVINLPDAMQPDQYLKVIEPRRITKPVPEPKEVLR